MSQQAEISIQLRPKLHRPQVTENLVPRPRLLEHLQRCRQRPLTMVVAPAGYGKTTLVSSWLQAFDWPSAWLSLDEEDNDLVVFLTYFIAAIQTMFPQIGKETLALLKAATLPPLSILTRSLVNELDQIESAFILELDDYHHIHESAVHDLLEELLRHPPRSMHLVLTSRTDPPINLAKLRARSQVTEIRTHELRFTTAETTAFLQQELEVPVNDITVTALTNRLEGWAVGLRLVTISLRHRGVVNLASDFLDGEVAYVTDYLVAEILSQLPPAIKDFLLKTSILERLCGPLCDAVTGLDEVVCNGQAYLEWLHQQNLFIIPLDDQRQWYRYHNLFQELLQGQLAKKFGAEDIAALHSRTSAWFAQNGFIEDALHYALTAGDTGTAAQLVAQHRHEMMNQEQWHRLRHWIDLLPRDTVENNPRLLMVEAWLLIGWTEMVDVMQRVGTLLTRLPLESAETRKLQGEFDTLRSLISYHLTDGQQSLSLAQKALENLPPELASERGLAVMLKSLAYQMIGDLKSARSTVFEALREKATRASTYRARVMMTFCFLDYMAADLKSVLQSAEQVLKLGQELNLAESVAHGYYFLGLSHYERNELAAAENCLVPVVKGAYIANLHNFAFSSFVLALTYQAQGRSEEAREVVGAVANRAMEIGNISLLQTAQAFQAELAIRQGNITATNTWVNTFNPDPFYVAYRFYVPQITLPKRLLALNTPQSRRQAADFLARLYDFFTSIHNTRLLIEVLGLQALLDDAQGNRPAALEKLESAVVAAEPGGFIRLFVDLGPQMAGLLTRLRSLGVAPDYIGQILAAFPTPQPTEPSKRQADLIEPLSERELEILALLAERFSNKEIAAQLMISPGTVTQHAHNIYQKLHVTGRRQAVSKATELGILSPLKPVHFGSVAD